MDLKSASVNPPAGELTSLTTIACVDTYLTMPSVVVELPASHALADTPPKPADVRTLSDIVDPTGGAAFTARNGVSTFALAAAPAPALRRPPGRGRPVRSKFRSCASNCSPRDIVPGISSGR